MKSLHSLLAFTLCVPVCTEVFTAEREGVWSVSGGLGVNMVQDQTIDRYLTVSGFPGGATTSIRTEWENGVAVNAAVGYNWKPDIRFDVDVSYRQNDLKDAERNGIVITTTGDVAASTVLLNGNYIFFSNQPAQLYIGLGAGAAYIDCAIGDTIGSSGDQALAFAVQGQLGINVSVITNWDFFLQYSYLTTLGLDLKFSHSTATTTMLYDIPEYRIHAVTGGVRYYF